MVSQELMETEAKRHRSFWQNYLLATSTLLVSVLLLENVLGPWPHWAAQTVSMASNSSLSPYCVNTSFSQSSQRQKVSEKIILYGVPAPIS